MKRRAFLATCLSLLPCSAALASGYKRLVFKTRIKGGSATPVSDRIFVDVEGARVEGRVVRSRRQIDVRIVSPYQGLTAALHVAAFIPIPPAPDLGGPQGEATAAGMLAGLYRVGKFVEENKESLRKKTAEMDAAVERLDPEQFMSESRFREIRRDLRAQLRKGIINNKSCQPRLIQARTRAVERQRVIWHLEEQFFKSNFPMSVPVGTRDEVLAILRSSA
jgi:hypothetical protein